LNLCLQVAIPAETLAAVAFPTQSDLSRGIALFDLDGTLLPWDCQMLFCHRVLRESPLRRAYLPLFLLFAPFAKLLGDEIMKRIFLSYLWGMKADELKAHCRAFAEEVIFYPELVEEVERHRANGDLLVMVSASPEFYVVEIAKRLGFDVAMGTPVEVGEKVELFPDLENHKGHAKVERLKRWMPERFRDGKLPHSHGYTDSKADLPLLAICEKGTLVNPAPPLAKRGEQEGWRVFKPARPWRSSWNRWLRIAALVTGMGKNPGCLAKARSQQDG
jgi:HAD superfamily hydrolase (TIGR01490 family)